jgi:hypothetical protein
VAVGTATLGYPGGPAVAFRIDPESISWNWQVVANVIETIGGRVIQIIGAYLSDMTVSGSLGQDHKNASSGESWQQANEFLRLVTKIMEFQSQDSNQQGVMHQPAVFSYPPKNWRFNVYVKALTDPDADTSVQLRPGKFNQRYTLTLFLVQDASSALVKAGTTNGVFSQKAYDAVAAFMARISDGIGWSFTQYNGQATGTLPSATTTPGGKTTKGATTTPTPGQSKAKSLSGSSQTPGG